MWRGLRIWMTTGFFWTSETITFPLLKNAWMSLLHPTCADLAAYRDSLMRSGGPSFLARQGVVFMSLLSSPASSCSSPCEFWTTAFYELGQRMRRFFARSEPHQHALAYLRGLMSDVPRKNGWQVAEAVGEATPYAIQHVLDRAKWDCDGVRDELTTSIRETLATPGAVVVIDETGFREIWRQIGRGPTTVQRHSRAH